MSSLIAFRAVYSVITLYMLLILVRWLGAYLELDLYGRLRWVRRLTDPLLDLLRRVVPPMGPIDLSPLAALGLLWLLRIILVRA